MLYDSVHKRYLFSVCFFFPQDNIETEYKFARAQLWADYIGDGVATLPPPLNLIPSPKSVVRWACKLTNRCFGVPKKLPCCTNVSRCSSKLDRKNKCQLFIYIYILLIC